MSRRNLSRRRQNLKSERNTPAESINIVQAITQGHGEVRLPLGSIRTDGNTQPREALDPQLVEEYSQRMVDGSAGVVDPEDKQWEALTVHHDGQEYWLSDGFHRYHAAKAAGMTTFQANVLRGSLRDAVLYTFGVNADHGKRRTRADKRRIVSRALEDAEWRAYTDARLAKLCKVSQAFVNQLRKELEQARKIAFEQVLEAEDGREFEREPPRALDARGFLKAPEGQAAPASAEPSSVRSGEVRSSDPGTVSFDDLAGVGGVDTVVAFPISASDYMALSAAIERALSKGGGPTLLLTPLANESVYFWQGPQLLHGLVEGAGFSQPTLVQIQSHHRHYVAWARGRTLDASYASPDELFADRGDVLLVGHPLGGWRDLT